MSLPRRVTHVAGLLTTGAIIAVLLAGGAGARSLSQAQPGTPGACPSPESTPEGTPALVALQDLATRLTGSPTPCPTPTPGPTGTPSLTDQLATAAALVQTATAVAGGAEPAATAPPATGGEGEIAEALPAVDLPVTNPQGYSFNLGASLTADFSTVAPEAPVYRLTPIILNRDQVQAMADALGIGGTVDDRGNGNFTVVGSGQLFVTPALTQYLSPAQPGDGPLPDDARAIDLAREWLRTSPFVQPDIGEGRVVGRVEEARRMVIVFTPVEPTNLLSGYPSISVSLGPDGVVLEVSSHWATITRGDLYALQPAEEAWRRVETGEAYIEASLDGAGFEDGAVISGLVQYDRIEIAYTTAGPPGGTQYLAPIYMFSGLMTPEGRAESYPIRAYVPALAISDTPVGMAPGAPAAGLGEAAQ